MNEENDVDVIETPRRLHFEWILPLFYAPRRTLKTIMEQEHPVWLAPILVLSALALIMVLAGGPVRTQAAMMSSTLPEDFQYYTEEQMSQFAAAQQTASSPLFIYVFPAVGALAGVWIGWFLLGSILHLGLTMVGSRSSNAHSMNLAAWASLPFGVRYIVQGIYTIASQTVISSPGLSGLVNTDAGGFTVFISQMLRSVDVYLIWQAVLLLIGASIMTGLARRKSWTATLVVVIIILVLSALPGFIGAQLSGISSGGFFFF